jgi:hypothetical protein
VTRGEVRTYTLAHHFMKLLAHGDSLPAKFGNLSRGPSIYLSAKGPQSFSPPTRTPQLGPQLGPHNSDPNSDPINPPKRPEVQYRLWCRNNCVIVTPESR